MPTRVRSIDLDALPVNEFSSGVDYLLVKEGRRLAQITPITLPSSAAGLIGIRVKNDGDPLRLNAQGQPMNLDGADQTAGVWLVWLGTSLLNPAGVVEFALGFLDSTK